MLLLIHPHPIWWHCRAGQSRFTYPITLHGPDRQRRSSMVMGSCCRVPSVRVIGNPLLARRHRQPRAEIRAECLWRVSYRNHVSIRLDQSHLVPSQTMYTIISVPTCDTEVTLHLAMFTTRSLRSRTFQYRLRGAHRIHRHQPPFTHLLRHRTLSRLSPAIPDSTIHVLA